jgi:hypothetical protein
VASHVTIDLDALAAYAAELQDRGFTVADWRLPVYPGDHSAFVEFIGIQNAVNACFADLATAEKYTVTYDGVAWSGAMGLCAALMRAELLEAGQLANLDLGLAATIFAGDDVELPLLAERVAYLNSLAPSIARWGGSFGDLVDRCHYDAARIVNVLATQFPAYAGDRWLHPVTKQLHVFDKRARLFAVMYEGRARVSDGELPRLSNLDTIGPIVDYQLPRALRAAGVLAYSDELAGIVDRQQILPAGSAAEVELRAATSSAIWDLLANINTLRTHAGDTAITMVELDYALWVAGRTADGAHHLTPTLAY